MKRLRYIILALAAVLSFAAVSCTPQEEYAPGKQDVEGCFGVYFPSQEATSQLLTFEPTDKRRVKITIAREISDVEDDIVVPVNFTGDEVFEIDEVIFEGGAAQTSFYVNFPDAELSKKYTCTLEVTDPQFVSNYRTKPNYITFSVSVVSWDELGEATLIDRMFTNIQTGEFMNVQTKVYRNSNDKTLYRVDNPYPAFMEAAGAASKTPAPKYFEFKVLEKGQKFLADEALGTVTIPLEDMVYYEPMFLSYADPSYGDAYYYHPAHLIGYENPVTWYDNRVLSWQDNQKTLPGLVQLAPSLLFPKAGGFDPAICVTIVFPGARLTDYTLSLSAGYSENGVIPMNVMLGEDVAELKYAIFDGELSEKEINAKIKGIADGSIKSKSITEGGEFTLENLGETGRYTIVAVAFDESGAEVNSTAKSFGYVKNGDEKPVDIHCGLILSEKYAPEGYTSENSAEFYIYGKDIKEACYGLYRKKDFDEKYDEIMEDLKYFKVSDEELEAINGKGLSDLFIRLNSGMEYVLVVTASNGYQESTINAFVLMNGELNPLQMTYDLDVLRPAESKQEYCKEWVFWTGTPSSNGRVEVGPVTITDGGKETVKVEQADGTEEEIEVDYLKVKGFWKPAVDEKYLKDDTMKWEYYGGAIVPLHDKVGEWRDQGGNLYTFAMLSFFTSGTGGFADGAVCGAFTDEGNVAFVDMETGNYDELGSYWFTALGVFDSQGNYMIEKDLLRYDEMLFVDPANLPGENDDNTAETFSVLHEAKAEYQMNFNCVETTRTQIHKAIDKAFSRTNVRSYGHRAGLEIEVEHNQVDGTLEPSSGGSFFLHHGEFGSVSLR